MNEKLESGDKIGMGEAKPPLERDSRGQYTQATRDMVVATAKRLRSISATVNEVGLAQSTVAYIIALEVLKPSHDAKAESAMITRLLSEQTSDRDFAILYRAWKAGLNLEPSITRKPKPSDYNVRKVTLPSEDEARLLGGE